MTRVGLWCSIHSVLWSPVGAPAGVPGPRRNADDCDAGWFAPVATRRRAVFGALWAPSPWLPIPPDPEWGDGTVRVSHGPGAWCPFFGPWAAGAYGLSGHDCPMAVCTFRQRCARWGRTQRAPEILTRAPHFGP